MVEGGLTFLRILGFDLIMESIGAVISFLVAYYALKAYRFSEEGGFLYLHFAFMVLGVSMAIRVFGTLYTFILARTIAVAGKTLLMVSITSGILRLASYSLLTITYVRQARKPKTLLPALLLLAVNPYLEILCITMLVYVVAQSAINYALSRLTDSLLVFVAFLLILLSHMFFAASVATPSLYLPAHILQLLGFMSMLAMLMRVSGES